MNEQNLQDNYPLLISYMERGGYSKFYIDRFRHEIKHIIAGLKLNIWEFYTDVYLSYEKKIRIIFLPS